MNRPDWWRACCSGLLRMCPAETPGKTRLARWLLGAMSVANVRVAGRFDESFLVPNLGEPVARSLLLDGVYEPQTRKFILQHLRPGSVFVDIGANVGVFTVAAARRVGPAGRVIAVEASPTVFSYLAENTRANRVGNVRAECCALTDADGGSADFYEAPSSHFGMGSLARQFGSAARRVPTRTLDSLLAGTGDDRVDLIKIDVEGFESAVFRGARRLLTGPRPPKIVFEFCDWAERRAFGRTGDAQRVLLEYGYRLWRLESWMNGGRPTNLVQERGSEMFVARPR